MAKFEYIKISGFELKTEIKGDKRIIYLNENDILLMKHQDGRYLTIFEHSNYWKTLLKELNKLKEGFCEEFFVDEEYEWKENFPQIVQFMEWLEKTESGKFDHG